MSVNNYKKKHMRNETKEICKATKTKQNTHVMIKRAHMYLSNSQNRSFLTNTVLDLLQTGLFFFPFAQRTPTNSPVEVISAFTLQNIQNN